MDYKKKLKENVKKHRYNDLCDVRNYKLLKQYQGALSVMKERYSYSEGDRVPVIHWVVPIIDRMLYGQSRQIKGRAPFRTSAALQAQPDDVPEIKAFRALLLDANKSKELGNSFFVHSIAVILCPSAKHQRFLVDLDDGKYDKREWALKTLKLWLSDLADAMDEEDKRKANVGDEEDTGKDADDDEQANDKVDSDGDEAMNSSGFGTFEFQDDATETRESARNKAKKQLRGYLEEVHTKEDKLLYWKNPFDYWMNKKMKSRYSV